MRQPLFISDDNAHSRRIVVCGEDWQGSPIECMFCGSQDAIDVDTSDGEYLSFSCCARCFTALCERNTKEKEA